MSQPFIYKYKGILENNQKYSIFFQKYAKKNALFQNSNIFINIIR